MVLDYETILYEETPQAIRLAALIKQLNVNSAIDIGCGPGIYVQELQKLDIHAVGIDIDSRATGKNIYNYSVFSEEYNKLVENKFDLAICLEVAEHIDNSKSAELIQRICQSSNIILFSAAPPGQGGIGHINCQPKEYWINFFNTNGFYLDIKTTDKLIDDMIANNGYHMGWFRNNAMIFKKSEESLFWGNCLNTFDEDRKHYVYAKYMGLAVDNLENNRYYLDAQNKSVLDIGGGPTSMLLKCQNLKKGKIIDPLLFPEWVQLRYKTAKIEVENIGGEEINEKNWDEVWLYNCLQHVKNPQKILQNAKKSGAVVRIFEWINFPLYGSHICSLNKENLDKWLNYNGSVIYVEENGCFGNAYFGVVK